MKLSDLTQYDLIYMGTPYSLFPLGRNMAAMQAGAVAARLLAEGVNVWAPIPYGHIIEAVGQLKPNDLGIWNRLNGAFLKKCDALLVVTMDGWRNSVGIFDEIRSFVTSNKPILYLNPITFELSVTP